LDLKTPKADLTTERKEARFDHLIKTCDATKIYSQQSIRELKISKHNITHMHRKFPKVGYSGVLISELTMGRPRDPSVS